MVDACRLLDPDEGAWPAKRAASNALRKLGFRKVGHDGAGKSRQPLYARHQLEMF